MSVSRYSIVEARKNLPSVVTAAEAGEDVELTRRGRPVAVVMSLERYHRLKGRFRTFGESYRAFRGAFDLAEVGLDDEDTALRDPSAGRDVRL